MARPTESKIVTSAADTRSSALASFLEGSRIDSRRAADRSRRSGWKLPTRRVSAPFQYQRTTVSLLGGKDSADSPREVQVVCRVRWWTFRTRGERLQIRQTSCIRGAMTRETSAIRSSADRDIGTSPQELCSPHPEPGKWGRCNYTDAA
jgi:hypothetical protein